MNDARPGRTSALVALNLGLLPATKINLLLELKLATAEVGFSVRAQRHSRARHPADFELCRRHVGRIVSDPDYIGRGPHQTDGFELIGEVRGGQAIILVAIKLRLNDAGRYVVASTYLIDANTLERRLRKGFAKPA